MSEVTERIRQAEFLKPRDIVYHVANPLVPGMILGSEPKAAPQTAYVMFFEPVGSSGNPYSGTRLDWYCNPDLLYRTPEQALRNHNPS